MKFPTVSLPLSILLAMFAVTSEAASQTFGPEKLVGGYSAIAGSSLAADMDGDGDLDLLHTFFGSGTVTWYENQSDGLFSVGHVITKEFYSARSAAAADLDGDGDLDVVVARQGFAPLSWFENLGGGSFGPSQGVAAIYEDAIIVRVADVDGDGDNDLIATLDFGRRIRLFENLGAGVFGNIRTIGQSTFAIHALEWADLDLDGDLDCVWSSGFADQVNWQENLGSGTFGVAQIVTAALDDPRGIDVQDVDGDGDFDLLVASYADDKVSWIENVPGGFAAPQTVDLFNGVIEVAARDVDFDGDLDLLAISVLDDRIVLYENLGAGSFGPRQVVAAVVEARNLLVFDVDGEGDVDVIAATNNGAVLVLNLGTNGFEEPRFVTFSTLQTGALNLSDLDADGDLDLLGLNPFTGKVISHENVNGDAFGPASVIGAGLIVPSQLERGDMNGDGQLDIVVGSGSYQAIAANVSWYANLGAQGFGPEQTASSDFSDSGAIFALGDMDGDGDLDVLKGYLDFFAPQKLVWNVNDGSGSFTTGPTHDGLAYRVLSIWIEDLDGDGDGDAILAIEGGIVWRENMGAGVLGPIGTLLTTGASNTHVALQLVDLDMDGDRDLLFRYHALSGAGQVGWIEQLAGAAFGPVISIESTFDAAGGIVAADIDMDSDMDVIVGRGDSGPDSTRWYENFGGGVFSATQFLPMGSTRVGALLAADLDNDTDLDFLLFTNQGLIVRSNDLRIGTGFCGPSQVNSSGMQALLSADGSAVAANNSITLLAGHLPPNQFGFCLVATQAAPMPFPPAGSQGLLCLSGAVGRLNRPGEIFFTSASGEASVVLDLSNVSTPVGTEVLVAGDTRHFQAWFRDANPGSTSNLTNGLRIQLR